MRNLSALLAGVMLTIAGIESVNASSPFETLDAILRASPQLRTVEEWIPLLPQEFRDNWTAAYQSRGLAKRFTTPENPRVLAFSKSNQVVLTYSNCAPVESATAYTDCNSVEAIGFNEEKNDFELKVYRFPGISSGNLQVTTENNPTKCMKCHAPGGQVKPLWEPYNFWPKFYGSIADRAAEKREYIGYGSLEFDNYQKFLSAHWSTEGPTPVEPRGTDRYNLLSMKWENYVSPEQAQKQGYMYSVHSENARPAHDLTEFFYQTNFKKLGKSLTARSGWDREKYLLAWWGRCFEANTPHTYITGTWDQDYGIDELYSTSYRKLVPYIQLRDAMLEEIKEDYAGALSLFNQESADSRHAILAEREILFYNQAAPMLKRLTEILGDVDYEQWNLSFQVQRHNFASPSFGLKQFQMLLNSEVNAKEASLASFSCVQLKEKSQAALVAGSPL